MNKDNPKITIEELLENLKYITSKKELKVINDAYLFALEKHNGEKRLTGVDYIKHPLNVACILSSISADYETVAAALLHDVIDIAGVQISEIKKKFGDNIASLVEGVTKINRLNYNGDNESTIANYRKIFVGLTKDVRVIIIKLADRLHNLRTMYVLSEKKQRETSKETLAILTPIAHRLGMNKIKGELEDLSLRYSKPDAYFSIVERLNKTKTERNKYVEEMIENVSNLLNKNGIKHEIKGRAKSIYSIYKKLDTGRKFTDIYDLLALRVFVDKIEECYQVMSLIHSVYKPVPKRYKDYIAMPKNNGYQSLHTTVFGRDGNFFEIQVRTYEMDKVAEHGVASHWSYKEKGKTLMQSAMEEKLQFFRSVMELNESSDEEFVHRVNEEILSNVIYVYTPKGDVVELPLGSTPIDFAYRVHTEVGNKMVGAIVNNNIVPLDYKLNDNDIIKINTNKNSNPNRDWIDMCFTQQAKNKIKSFFNKVDKTEYEKRGEELLTRELRKRKMVINDFLSHQNLDKIYTSLKIDNINDLYMEIGNNKYTANQIINLITNDMKTKEQIILDKIIDQEVKETISKHDILVEGIDNIKINMAGCCKAIPGDEIIGYVSKGNGIVIHRSQCPNITDENERIVNVSWNKNIHKKYDTNVLIKSNESKDILLNIVAKSSNIDLTIQSINTVMSSDIHIYELNILTSSKDVLEKFMKDIQSMTNIISVERVIK
ncbi:MAG: bifunctional (p)ppGpp synthetase/guanosine-3',5'-bis(diphosphate) 3'-pyrophosphohydrolase [Bacilli bacterium]|nr:bifunctional (p)ppGpp synthetase/guanosine-3',5'-bis(diphosphate) 3'-pyrophosphohydrolase [Bacilli bacterium]